MDLPDIPKHLHASQTLNQIPTNTLIEAKLLLQRAFMSLEHRKFPCYVKATRYHSNGHTVYETNIADDAIQLVVEKLKKAGYQAKKTCFGPTIYSLNGTGDDDHDHITYSYISIKNLA